ncbi:hypothetical protein ET445_11015 [Agromyces protaetiae]|uniref:Uncharacterized protein n=1 Tax=Agromyces protaetiae TaxID=2509455 RepID=A0A4P6FTB3_9MICO|nr:hypothetical protein [Agromyces protaetiae]QAY73798.1 hypothetical protein ET445_11015 [Agromyces protaetiae]
MILRRVFYRWLFIAVVVLPLWLAIGWAIFGSGGWGTLGLLIVLPASFLALFVIAIIVRARPTVREQKAVSWGDVGVLGAWHASIVAAGFYGDAAVGFGVLAIALSVVAFWWALVQLLRDGARRVQATMDEFERVAAQQRGEAPTKLPPVDAGEVIVVRESRPSPEQDGPARPE